MQLKDFDYKQAIWREYNYLFNKYASINDSYSINCRLIHMNPETSNLDNIGGSMQNWSSRLTQLNWRIYENVPLFTNAPAITSEGQLNAEDMQSFTATVKFIYEPLPNDMLMFYDDPSQTIYHITAVRYHKTIQSNLKVFEVDLQTTPIDIDTFYDNLAIESHEYFNFFNKKLYDYLYFREQYKPVLDDIDKIIRKTNDYFNEWHEMYKVVEYNMLISEILRISHWGAILEFKVPIGFEKLTEEEIESMVEQGTMVKLEFASINEQELYETLLKIREIFCD